MDRVHDWDFTRGFEAAHAAGFNDYELLQLRERWSQERDRELRRRVTHVLKDARQRIRWEGATENLIPIRPGNITPCLGYMVLPIRTEKEAEEFNVLVLPPLPQKAVEILWPWSSEFISWLMDPKADRGIRWLQMMLEEFGLPEEGQKAWSSPHCGASVLNIKKHAAFWRELQAARIAEAHRRIQDMAAWLASHSLDGAVSFTPHLVVLGAESDYDPEKSTFIFSVSLSGQDTCLISRPDSKDPVYLHQPFIDARNFVARLGWIDQHLWLKRLLKNF